MKEKMKRVSQIMAVKAICLQPMAVHINLPFLIFEKRYLSAPADKQKRTAQRRNHDSSSKNEPTGMAAFSATQQL